MKTLKKITKIAFESLFLLAFVSCLSVMVTYIFAVKEDTHKVMFAVLSVALGGLIYAWSIELAKTIKK